MSETQTVELASPVVGTGVTMCSGSDRYPGTIVDRNGDNFIFVRADKAKRLDDNGASERQDYRYSRDPNGQLYTFRRGRNGKWYQVVQARNYGGWNDRPRNTFVKVPHGRTLIVGVRERYFDYSF